ncbi:MAG: TetR/AcrR family transcriptional regulator [Lachnospiraceae bacterium]|nr:TetR/AcrR family transcriptional regulator [Lachnospiraceae bacterium]MDE7019949.1 TetR/AcrR family transcriptional regulator [Lachnospiraceae bacterium]
MGEKSLQKKQYILETARKVFVEKGYKNVTMKDIVEACDISRGGLYLYFGSTEELLLEVLQKDAEEIDDVFSEGITEEDSAADILTLFLKEQKKELLRKKNNLTMAVYEYAFENKEKKDQMMRRQFEAGVRVLEKLIESGIASGEFYCENPKGAANNIMYVLEGMKINSQTMGITEAMVDEQLLYIMAGLLIDVD